MALYHSTFRRFAPPACTVRAEGQRTTVSSILITACRTLFCRCSASRHTIKRWGLRAWSLSADTKADAGQNTSINHLNPNVLYMMLAVRAFYISFYKLSFSINCYSIVDWCFQCVFIFRFKWVFYWPYLRSVRYNIVNHIDIIIVNRLSSF